VTTRSIQLGQVWRSDATGDDWLVTRVHAELFDAYAVLRKAAGPEPEVQHIKVARSDEGVTLPGFSLIQEAETC